MLRYAGQWKKVFLSLLPLQRYQDRGCIWKKYAKQKETECQELKNIQYKSMLLNGTNLPKTKSTNNLSMLDTFLEQEKKHH